MANAFLDAQVYANSMLYLVMNELVMGRSVNSKFVNQVSDQNGLSISQKRPPRFVAKDGEALALQDNVIGSQIISVDQYKNVHFAVGDLEYIQSFNALLKNSSMMSAASTLAIAVDQHLHSQTLRFSNWVGTAGQVISSPQQFNAAPQRLDLLGVPQTNRTAAVFTDDAYGITNNLIDSNALQNVAKSALERGRIPLLSNTKAYMTQQSQALTTGTRLTTGALVDGAAQNVNYSTSSVRNTMTQTLVLDGFQAGATVAQGDVFTIADVLAVNPRTAEAYAHEQQFTVTEAGTASGAGALTVTITPPIIVPNTGGGTDADVNTAFATVNAAPADNAALTFVGNPSTLYRYSSAFHKDAISLVYARLTKPATGISSFATDKETGVTIRYWRGSDISTGQHIHRWDMAFGAAAMDPLLGTRLSGEA